MVDNALHDAAERHLYHTTDALVIRPELTGLERDDEMGQVEIGRLLMGYIEYLAWPCGYWTANGYGGSGTLPPLNGTASLSEEGRIGR